MNYPITISDLKLLVSSIDSKYDDLHLSLTNSNDLIMKIDFIIFRDMAPVFCIGQKYNIPNRRGRNMRINIISEGDKLYD
jgi:hypothetical protein